MTRYTKWQLLGSLAKDIARKTLLRADELRKSYFDRENNCLAFDWNVAGHSADPIDWAKQMKNELKWGMQRFLRGYDDKTFWAYDSHLDELTRIALKWYIEKRNGSPILNDWTEENCHEKFTEVLKEMLHHFEQADDRWCNEKNEYEDIVDLSFKSIKSESGKWFTHKYKDVSSEAESIRKQWSDRSREIEKYQRGHHKQAVEMLAKYYKYLWD